jgi:hypothetical protein
MLSVIDSKAKRDKLLVRRKPHWAKVQAGACIGFRRTESGDTSAEFTQNAGQNDILARIE